MGVKDDRAAAISKAAMDRLNKRGARKSADRKNVTKMLMAQHGTRVSMGTRSRVSPTREDVIEAILEVIVNDSK
jgi:hypothetical protein